MRVFAHDDPLPGYLFAGNRDMMKSRWSSTGGTAAGKQELLATILYHWVWMDAALQLKVNVGRSFASVGVNELWLCNGVHHGTFRFRNGDATLSSEQGWQDR